MKILIDKEKFEDELNKLGQQTSYDEWEQGRKTGKMEVLESILQQGEEYNENWNEIMGKWDKIDSEARKNNNPKNTYDVIYWLREHYVAYKRKTI